MVDSQTIEALILKESTLRRFIPNLVAEIDSNEHTRPKSYYPWTESDVRLALVDKMLEVGNQLQQGAGITAQTAEEPAMCRHA
eukprot:1199843-Amphidinium_carterae.1